MVFSKKWISVLSCIFFSFVVFCFYWVFYINPYVFAQGFIEGKQFVIYPENDGKILSRYVKEGDLVSQGQLLVQLDDEPILHKKKESQTKLQKLREKQNLVKKNYDKSMEKYLVKRREKDAGKISEKDFVTCLQELEKNKQTVDEVKNIVFLEEMKLEAVDRKITKNKVLAPFEGTITKCYFPKDAFVLPSDSLFCLFDAKNIWGYAYVLEKDLSLIKKGQTVDITLSAYPNVCLKGKITQISSEVEVFENKRCVRCKVALLSQKLYETLHICNLMSARFVIHKS